MKIKAVVHFYSEKIEKKSFCFIPDVVAGVEIDPVVVVFDVSSQEHSVDSAKFISS